MDNIKDVLEERSKTHGDFAFNAIISQALKNVIRLYGRDTLQFDDQMKEALEVICGKIARIIAGDPYFSDHWRDIAGYATLIQNILEGKNDNGSIRNQTEV